MITPNTPVKITVAIVAALVSVGFGAAVAFGSKADKTELDPIRDQITSLQQHRAVDRVIQENMLKLMEKMDARMERIENNQLWQIQEDIKRRRGDYQQPPAGPSQSGTLR